MNSDQTQNTQVLQYQQQQQMHQMPQGTMPLPNNGNTTAPFLQQQGNSPLGVPLGMRGFTR